MMIAPASTQAFTTRHCSTSDPGCTTASTSPPPKRNPRANRRVDRAPVKTWRRPTSSRKVPSKGWNGVVDVMYISLIATDTQ